MNRDHRSRAVNPLNGETLRYPQPVRSRCAMGRDSPSLSAIDTQWVGAESWPVGGRCPPKLASFSEPVGPEFLGPSGGIRFEKATFQAMDQRIAQSDVVRVTAK